MSSGASKSVLIILHVEEGGVPLSGEDFTNLPGHAEVVSFANFPSSSEVCKSVFNSIKNLLHSLDLNNQLLSIKHDLMRIDGINNDCTPILSEKDAASF